MKYFLRKTLELIIVNKKVMDVTDMGWNPIECNKKVVRFVGKKKMIHSNFYFDNKGNVFEFDDLAIKYNLPLLDNKLWEIITKDYQPIWIRADRNYTKKSRFIKQYLQKRIKSNKKNQIFSFV